MTATVVHRRRLTPLLTAWTILLAIETFGQIALKMAGGWMGAFELDAPRFCWRCKRHGFGWDWPAISVNSWFG